MTCKKTLLSNRSKNGKRISFRSFVRSFIRSLRWFGRIYCFYNKNHSTIKIIHTNISICIKTMTNEFNHIGTIWKCLNICFCPTSFALIQLTLSLVLISIPIPILILKTHWKSFHSFSAICLSNLTFRIGKWMECLIWSSRSLFDPIHICCFYENEILYTANCYAESLSKEWNVFSIVHHKNNNTASYGISRNMDEIDLPFSFFPRCGYDVMNVY